MRAVLAQIALAVSAMLSGVSAPMPHTADKYADCVAFANADDIATEVCESLLPDHANDWCLSQQQIDHLKAQAIGDYLTDTEVIIEDVP